MARAASVQGLTARFLGSDDGYWRLRNLLRRAMVGNGRRELSWHVARLDYWWWFGNPDLETPGRAYGSHQIGARGAAPHRRGRR